MNGELPLGWLWKPWQGRNVCSAVILRFTWKTGVHKFKIRAKRPILWLYEKKRPTRHVLRGHWYQNSRWPLFSLCTFSFSWTGLFRSHVVLFLFKPTELIRGCDNLTFNSLFIYLFKYSCCVCLPSPVPEALVLAEVQKQCLDFVSIFGRGIQLLPVTPLAWWSCGTCGSWSLFYPSMQVPILPTRSPLIALVGF